jgi:hypothetical protein
MSSIAIMNPRHQNGNNCMINIKRLIIIFRFLDCLKTVRILGDDIFRLKFVQIIMKLILCTYSVLCGLQIYFFISSPSLTKLLSCGGVFFRMAAVIFCKMYGNCLSRQLLDCSRHQRPSGQERYNRRHHGCHRFVAHRFR